MKLEIIDNDSYKIFINNLYCNKVNINNKEELGKYIKDIILKVRKLYNVILHGLYEVHVYVVKFIGIILEIKNIDSYLSKTIDLKIIVHNDEEIYLQVYRYELIEKYNGIKYFNNYFFLNINELKKEDVYSIIESSKIIFGEDLLDIKKRWVSLTV